MRPYAVPVAVAAIVSALIYAAYLLGESKGAEECERGKRQAIETAIEKERKLMREQRKDDKVIVEKAARVETIIKTVYVEVERGIEAHQNAIADCTLGSDFVRLYNAATFGPADADLAIIIETDVLGF